MAVMSVMTMRERSRSQQYRRQRSQDGSENDVKF
jgi:hypothetical protein